MVKNKTAAIKLDERPVEKTIVYIGPNSLSDNLKRFTVYRGEPLELIKQAAAKYKNIGRLFVDVAQLNEAMAAVDKKGTPLNLAYSEIMTGRN